MLESSPLRAVEMVFVTLQLRAKYRRTDDGRGSVVEQMSNALDAAERSCPGFVDNFVDELIDGLLSSSLQLPAVVDALQKTKR